MLKLNLQDDAFWLELGDGVRVFVEPLDTLRMLRAQKSVIKELRDAEESIHDDDNQALIQVLLIDRLACDAILRWEGVYTADGSETAPVTHANIEALMDIWYIAQAFFEKYTSSLDVLHLEGNGSGSAASGISAAGQNTAEDATSSNSPAPKPRKVKTSAPTSNTNP